METTHEGTKRLGIGFEPEAVILGGGDFPTHPIPLNLLKGCECRVCCDGTANQWSQLMGDVLPWQVVGDGDSISEEAKEKFAGRITLSPDQETNDQTKAVDYIVGQNLRRIAILGATGRREDHTLGNIALLMEYFRRGLEVRIYTDYGVFIPCSGECGFECPKGTAVSIFNFGAEGFKSEGLAYPLYDFTSWWQGTLNHTTDDCFSLFAKGDYLVFINYENKKIRE